MFMKGILAESAPAAALPRAEQRRRGILEAALKVIAAGGVESVTHRRVASEAAVPLGSTTYYFSSREDLVREAFRYYLAEVGAVLTRLADRAELDSAAGVVDLLVEMARREFAETPLVLAEYELILYAARDKALAKELNAWERGLEAQVARTLDGLGAPRPFDAARTLVELMRGFEIGQLTRPAAGYDDLRRRLESVVSGLIGVGKAASAKTATARAKAARGSRIKKKRVNA